MGPVSSTAKAQIESHAEARTCMEILALTFLFGSSRKSKSSWDVFSPAIEALYAKDFFLLGLFTHLFDSPLRHRLYCRRGDSRRIRRQDAFNLECPAHKPARFIEDGIR